MGAGAKAAQLASPPLWWWTTWLTVEQKAICRACDPSDADTNLRTNMVSLLYFMKLHFIRKILDPGIIDGRP
jgi:hypothetical protein